MIFSQMRQPPCPIPKSSTHSKSVGFCVDTRSMLPPAKEDISCSLRCFNKQLFFLYTYFKVLLWRDFIICSTLFFSMGDIFLEQRPLLLVVVLPSKRILMVLWFIHSNFERLFEFYSIINMWGLCCFATEQKVWINMKCLWK